MGRRVARVRLAMCGRPGETRQGKSGRSVLRMLRAGKSAWSVPVDVEGWQVALACRGMASRAEQLTYGAGRGRVVE